MNLDKRYQVIVTFFEVGRVRSAMPNMSFTDQFIRMAWFICLVFIKYLHSYPTNEGKYVRWLSLFRLTGSRATSAHAPRLGEVQLGPCCGSEDNQTRLFLNFIH